VVESVVDGPRIDETLLAIVEAAGGDTLEVELRAAALSAPAGRLPAAICSGLGIGSAQQDCKSNHLRWIGPAMS
jgi:hypothetical protein